MDVRRLELLFGDLPEGFDPDDPDELAALIDDAVDGEDDGNDDDEYDDEDGDRPALAGQLLHVLAHQFLHDDPPEAWATAQRLLDRGMPREDAVRQLQLALLRPIGDVLRRKAEFDPALYVEALAWLPVPGPDEIADLAREIVRHAQPVAIGELHAGMEESLGGGPMVGDLIDQVIDTFLDEGELAFVPGDRVVEPRSFCADIVLTHRLTQSEKAIHALSVGVDLAAFTYADTPVVHDTRDELEPISMEPAHLAWVGPDGWLDRFEEGAVLAVRVDADGSDDEEVVFEVLDAVPEVTPELVAVLRAAYDEEWESVGLPVELYDVVLNLVASGRASFLEPTAPLSAIAAAAGLELRGGHLGHGPEVWARQRLQRRMRNVFDAFDDASQRRAAVGALAAFEETSDPAELREVLRGLHDVDVLSFVVEQLVGGDDPGELDAFEQFAERLVGAAKRPGEVAVARWLAAVAAERHGDPLAGEAHLQLAVEADGTWAPAVDRLAWYRSDRGDAIGAVRLWRRLPVPSDAIADLPDVVPFTRTAGPELARNDRCWCGSGRKYKHCHLGQPPEAPLPDRVGWLCRKTTAFVQRRGGVTGDLFELAMAMAGPDADETVFRQVGGDPLIIDIALFELGWFERFLEERAALLPDDEALLARAWALTERSVHEVVDVDKGVGMRVRDLRTGDLLQVRERSMSTQVGPGMLLCGRVVPDGETHQFIGGVFPVAPGTEKALIDLLDEGDGYELARYAGARYRPPVLHTRENEPITVCELVVEVPDRGAAIALLDERYEREDEAEPGEWIDLHDIGGGELIRRAGIALDGDRISVDAMSDPRADRVLAVLLDGLPGARVVADERRPLRPGEPPPFTGRRGGRSQPDPSGPGMQEAMAQIAELFEQRWCDEEIPALGGLTPRQAAADPTRREELERLIASFPDEAPAPGTATLRPARLRELLGL